MMATTSRMHQVDFQDNLAQYFEMTFTIHVEMLADRFAREAKFEIRL